MPTQLSDPEYVLRGVAGIVFGRSYHLLAPTTLGRAPECDIAVADQGISRVHARLRPLDYGVEIEDLKSTNGSFLNGQRVSIGVARVGDEIAFDQLRFRLDAVARPARTGAVKRGATQGSPRRWPWVVAALAIAAGIAALLLAR
ncbi:FHA domain-containing protein [Lysobacter solisilvae (ex Woo and Kim 2020)]|uniref:FHA domain-containing protein n=1 Tax=Agrilutibacter terrestris TaxID=2865112 RepID=A0A7H0FVK5_9GAMM|nr:FHA domain-containing protein [Lysobacter terrestris]QNP40071.1 FHA domain-containing protein [Lysobacter terrestris]